MFGPIWGASGAPIHCWAAETAPGHRAERLLWASPTRHPDHRAAPQPHHRNPERTVRQKYTQRVNAINALEPAMRALSDEQIRVKVLEFGSV
jgi:hypothetical protein